MTLIRALTLSNKRRRAVAKNSRFPSPFRFAYRRNSTRSIYDTVHHKRATDATARPTDWSARYPSQPVRPLIDDHLPHAHSRGNLPYASSLMAGWLAGFLPRSLTATRGMCRTVRSLLGSCYELTVLPYWLDSKNQARDFADRNTLTHFVLQLVHTCQRFECRIAQRLPNLQSTGSFRG